MDRSTQWDREECQKAFNSQNREAQTYDLDWEYIADEVSYTHVWSIEPGKVSRRTL